VCQERGREKRRASGEGRAARGLTHVGVCCKKVSAKTTGNNKTAMRNPILRHVPGKHFTQEKRMILETLWNVNVQKGRDTRLGVRAFAEAHGIPHTTLLNELKRGMEGEIFFDKIKRGWFYPEYSADKAQADADWKNAQKGTAQKFTNHVAEAFRHQIVDLKKSPAHARHDLLAQGLANLPCVSSVYNHIDHGDIGIQRGQTPYRPGRKRKRRPPPRRALKCPGNLSIEERPAHIAQRLEPGHWEMDTIVSCVGGRGGLLTLTERSSRYLLMGRMRSVTAAETRRVLRGFARDGSMKTPLSITTDNGSEFLDSGAIRRVWRKTNPDLRVYYTHSYAAWEKGSVENNNLHIRRFFPKGTDFSRVQPAQISHTRDFVNSIPRFTSLKGKTAHGNFSYIP